MTLWKARRICWFLVLAVGAILGGIAWAQERPGGRGRWRERGNMPEDPAARLRFRLERAEQWIASFDANQDGVIEPNEVQGQRRYLYERMAKEAGLDPSHSIAVGEFRTAVVRHIQQSEQQPKPPAGGPGGPPGGVPRGEGPRPGGAPGPGAPSSGGASAPTPSSSGLRGFGGETSQSLAKPAGFGSPGGTSGSVGTGSPSGGSGPPVGSRERQELEERVRQYAQSLLRQYDANKNGVLEREEWQNMRGSPEKADRNNDGVITLEELTAREFERNQLAVSGGSSSSSSGGSSGWTSASTSSSASGSSASSSRSSGSGSSGGSHSRSSGSSSKSGQPGRVRFLTPLERLPKGLPDWFIQKDTDGDGQVSMAEFAADWNDTKAAEFQKYDLNNDGIITPAECLRAEKSK